MKKSYLLLAVVCVATIFTTQAQNKVLETAKDDFISIAPITEMYDQETCTMEMWIKIDSQHDETSKQPMMPLFRSSVDANAGLIAQLWGTLDYVQIIWRNGNGNQWGNFPTGGLAKDVWHHLALVFDNNLNDKTRILLYVNGEAKTNLQNQTYAGNVPNTNTPLDLLVNFNGQADNVRVWNKAFTKAELDDNKLMSINDTHPLYSELICQYTFENKVGTTFTNTLDATKYVASITGSASLADAGSVLAIDNSGLTTGIFDKKHTSEFSIAPNPATSMFVVNGIQSAFNYIIYSVAGSVVDQGVSSNNVVNVEQLNKGVYFIQIENKGVTKFIKK